MSLCEFLLYYGVFFCAISWQFSNMRLFFFLLKMCILWGRHANIKSLKMQSELQRFKNVSSLAKGTIFSRVLKVWLPRTYGINILSSELRIAAKFYDKLCSVKYILHCSTCCGVQLNLAVCVPLIYDIKHKVMTSNLFEPVLKRNAQNHSLLITNPLCHEYTKKKFFFSFLKTVLKSTSITFFVCEPCVYSFFYIGQYQGIIYAT